MREVWGPWKNMNSSYAKTLPAAARVLHTRKKNKSRLESFDEIHYFCTGFFVNKRSLIPSACFSHFSHLLPPSFSTTQKPYGISLNPSDLHTLDFSSASLFSCPRSIHPHSFLHEPPCSHPVTYFCACALNFSHLPIAFFSSLIHTPSL